MHMLNRRHHQTRTYGRVPAKKDLLVPKLAISNKGPARKDWPLVDERIKPFVDTVKNELVEDEKDVRGIYAGEKGMPRLRDLRKITNPLRRLSNLNRSRWGVFFSG